MTLAKDDWVIAAMTDDVLVADLLLRLNHSPSAAKPSAVIPLRWGSRLPRSRQASAAASSVRCDVVSPSSKGKEGDSSSARCSPTTPLCWSGSGSGGGGGDSPTAFADGFEETSRCGAVRSPPCSRSKGTCTTETTSTTIKRSRRKKTFVELKEEESFLLRDTMHLKKELANLRATFEEQRARNDKLKRIKLDLNWCSRNSSSAFNEPEKVNCCQSNPREASSLNCIPPMLLTHVKVENHPQSDSCQSDVGPNHDRFLLLPDLNMMPSEEDFGTETKSGMR